MIKNTYDFVIDDLIKSWRDINSKHIGPIFPSKSVNIESKLLKKILLERCVGSKIKVTHNGAVYDLNLYSNSLPCGVWQIWLKWDK